MMLEFSRECQGWGEESEAYETINLLSLAVLVIFARLLISQFISKKYSTSSKVLENDVLHVYKKNKNMYKLGMYFFEESTCSVSQ
jgi:hypothetical protein